MNYEVNRDKDGSVKNFHRRDAYRTLATISDGGYRSQIERNKILRKLENNVPRSRYRDTPVWL